MNCYYGVSSFNSGSWSGLTSSGLTSSGLTSSGLTSSSTILTNLISCYLGVWVSYGSGLDSGYYCYGFIIYDIIPKKFLMWF